MMTNDVEDRERTLIPAWANAKWLKTKTAISNVSKSVVKANRAMVNLENHKVQGTFPNSFAVNVKVQVDKAHQSQMDEILDKATEEFQKTLLDGLIEARKKERADRNSDLQDVKTELIFYFADNLTDLRSIGVVKKTEQECKMWIEDVSDLLDLYAEATGREIQLEDHFEAKKKAEEIEARKAAREEQRINQTLVDPAIQALQKQVNSLESKLKKSAASSSTTKKAEPPKQQQAKGKKVKQHPKGQGPSKPKTSNGGPQNQGQGNGNRKQSRRSTPSIARSGSKKRN